MALIISAALGGSKGGSKPNVKDPERVDVTAGAQTIGDAVMMMNRMLSIG